MYELLKTLKEVGYPQKQEKNYYAPDCNCGLASKYRTSEEPYEPTTDELIEELGDKFLNVHVSGKEYGAFGDDGTEELITARGSTPKEALIRLYISLHSK